jgi:GTP cyclohydrolase I
MKEQTKFIKDRVLKQFPNITEQEFKEALLEYNDIKDFKANENIFNTQNITDIVHYIMRLNTQYFIIKAFNAMKIDMNDPNITEDLQYGNIGTPGRIAKVWCGANINDDNELGGGRWAIKPRIARFPNTTNSKLPITKKIDLISSCSHHFISFNSIYSNNSYVLISYIPEEFILGISKLQRLVNWISQRFFLQEDLTKMIYDEISTITQTKSVYVGLFNIVHGCENLRGIKSREGSFTTEYYDGEFNKLEVRKGIKQ